MTEPATDNSVKGITARLEKALQDESTRNKIVEFLERFSKIKRDEFLTRYGGISKYIDEMCGEHACNVLFEILSLSLPEVTASLERIENKNVRAWLKELNRKYLASYEGVFPPIPHDWYRILWTTKADFSHGNIPLIEATILKRNGESVYFEMPFQAMAMLINHMLRQLCREKEFKVLEIPGMKAELMQMKKIVDSVMKE